MFHFILISTLLPWAKQPGQVPYGCHLSVCLMSDSLQKGLSSFLLQAFLNSKELRSSISVLMVSVSSYLHTFTNPKNNFFCETAFARLKNFNCRTPLHCPPLLPVHIIELKKTPTTRVSRFKQGLPTTKQDEIYKRCRVGGNLVCTYLQPSPKVSNAGRSWRQEARNK